ncbi:MAG: hypothetical protein WBC05_25795 [Sedimentisphaerales bacterium]
MSRIKSHQNGTAILDFSWLSHLALQPIAITARSAAIMTYSFDVSLPTHLGEVNMHLDPDFKHLTYGDEGAKGRRIYEMWKNNVLDFLVFYAGIRDVNPNEERLVYAIIGFYWIDDIVRATTVPLSRCNENAHTRRARPGEDEIVVRAKREESGRLKRCVPIGCYRPRCDKPHGHPSYHVRLDLLTRWGDLSVSDGYLQRSAYIPEFKNAEQFIEWFRQYEPDLVARNNLIMQCCGPL